MKEGRGGAGVVGAWDVERRKRAPVRRRGEGGEAGAGGEEEQMEMASLWCGGCDVGGCEGLARRRLLGRVT